MNNLCLNASNLSLFLYIPGHGKKTKQLLTKITHPNSIAQATLLSKTNDGTIGFTYKKLVVPSSMRSAYWKYFGFPATDDGLILSKLKIICILCKTQISYNRNTSNLRMHLQNKHKDELVQLEIECPPKVLKPKSMLQVPQKKNKSSEHYIYAADVDNPMGNDIQFLANGVNVSNEFEHFDEGHDEVSEVIYYLNFDLKLNVQKRNLYLQFEFYPNLQKIS